MVAAAEHDINTTSSRNTTIKFTEDGITDSVTGQ